MNRLSTALTAVALGLVMAHPEEILANLLQAPTAVATPHNVYLTSGTTWPTDATWNNASHYVEAIGGGGGGGGFGTTTPGNGGNGNIGIIHIHWCAGGTGC
jgi:hypothetical protein